MYPDQTDPTGAADLGLHCLPKRFLKLFIRRKKQTIFVVIGALRANVLFIFMLGSQADCCKCSYFDCQDYQSTGHNTSDVYQIIPVGMYNELSVFCDFKEDSGGWIVSNAFIKI